MVLHEYYFGNLRSGGAGTPNRDSAFYRAAELSFGRYDLWKTDFIGVAKIRGVGWAICYQDPLSKRLSNHWITLQEVGNVAGFTPILVIDVWEHAFLLDYKPSSGPSTSRHFSPTSIAMRLSRACRKGKWYRRKGLGFYDIGFSYDLYKAIRPSAISAQGASPRCPRDLQGRI
jgi:hypothetical protein